MPVIGLGEVGRAVRECLRGDNTALHVCFPWSEDFVERVRYMSSAWSGLVIIHSTVPVGTTEQIPNAVHAPIRGRHPGLVDGIRNFTMYVGGDRARDAVPILRAMGILEIVITPDSNSIEALKLWDTTYYGWNIVFQKAVKRYCDKLNLDYSLVYEHANGTYNEYHRGSRFERPCLVDMFGPIGGHCVIPNCKLLDDDIARYILEFNETIK